MVRFPHWPVVASGLASTGAVAVVRADRVIDASPVALDEGVVVGGRRREAQSRCPQVEIIEHDPSRDARRFEPIVAALSDLAPRLEVTRPGCCLVPTRGPSRYHGGDEALAVRVLALVDEVVAETCGVPVGLGEGRHPTHSSAAPGRAADPLGARVGVADGPVPAALAARTAPDATRWQVVAPGQVVAFLAPLSVAVLDELFDTSRPVRGRELIGLWRRLGIETLGTLGGFSAADVLGRFGEPGAQAHRLARGQRTRHLDVCPVPPDLEVHATLDPPVERVEGAAFLARGLADELGERLSSRGLACTRVAIEATTDRDEQHLRIWRHDGPLRARDIAERVRWQLDGWLAAGPGARPSGGLTTLVLRPDEVVADRGRQMGFWGGEAGVDDRVVRAVGRLEGLLGPEAVRVPELRGGRGPAERVHLVAAAAVELSADREIRGPAHDAPWPGRVPAPAPAIVFGEPLSIEVLAADGAPVVVDARGELSSCPEGVRTPTSGLLGESGAVTGVAGWAGPWPVDERWWDPRSHRRRARLQLLLSDGRAVLVASERRRWWCEGVYD